MPEDKLKLLKSLKLLDRIPEGKLATLGEYLKARSLKDGESVFEEGSKGDSLFFVSAGKIRISKRIGKAQSKDLAVLGGGDCFGEMALVDAAAARSASASAAGEATVLELARADLDRWFESNPELALGFFAELVQVQSRRLRRTSNELALLFDLSSELLERHAAPKDLLGKVLGIVIPHLQGTWSAAAYLYNIFNDELDYAGRHGDFEFEVYKAKIDLKSADSRWLDGSVYLAALPGAQRPQGFLLFNCETEQTEEARAENARTLLTVARLVSAAVENIGFRNEEQLRSRLRGTSYGPNI